MDPRGKSLKISALVILTVMSLLLSGCSAVQFLSGVPAPPSGAEQTAIALQVAALAATSAAMQPPQPAEPLQSAQPAQPQPPTLAPQPTYTPLPTYTPVPTFTPLPTYTPFPTFTLPAVSAPAGQRSPTPNPEQRGCCTLRVRNMFQRTYWIGAKMPYGGNFIKPRWYVEFYPPEPTWMRIWVCRYTSYFYKHWKDYGWWFYKEDWEDPWNWNFWTYWRDRGHLYNCFYRDVMVDETLIEISVP
jgi:hypothetical protein